jgi:hypothetical protein
MKTYDKADDWTFGQDNDFLKETAEENISFSKFQTYYLPKFGFEIYDTSTEREQVFNQIIKDTKSQILTV